MSDPFKEAVKAGEQADAAGRAEEAIKHFSRAIELSPDEKLPYLYRAAALSNSGRHEEALKDYNGILMRDPGHAPALWGRGTIFRRLNRLDDSLADLDAAIQLQNIPVYHLEKANTLIVAEKFQEALGSLGEVVKMAMENQDVENTKFAMMALRTKAQIFRAHGDESTANALEQQAAKIQLILSGRGSKKSGCGGSAAAALLCLLPFALRWLVG